MKMMNNLIRKKILGWRYLCDELIIPLEHLTTSLFNCKLLFSDFTAEFFFSIFSIEIWGINNLNDTLQKATSIYFVNEFLGFDLKCTYNYI